MYANLAAAASCGTATILFELLARRRGVNGGAASAGAAAGVAPAGTGLPLLAELEFRLLWDLWRRGLVGTANVAARHQHTRWHLQTNAKTG
jgi:hypothetical protein